MTKAFPKHKLLSPGAKRVLPKKLTLPHKITVSRTSPTAKIPRLEENKVMDILIRIQMIAKTRQVSEESQAIKMCEIEQDTENAGAEIWSGLSEQKRAVNPQARPMCYPEPLTEAIVANTYHTWKHQQAG